VFGDKWIAYLSEATTKANKVPFEILNFDDWNLFEPALARLAWFIPLCLSALGVDARNAVGVKSVWARDL
jgi:hypothetical protein